MTMFRYTNFKIEAEQMKKYFKYILLSAALMVPVAEISADEWQDITAKAKGQTVYFHAWAGSPEINAYIQSIGAQLKEKYGVTLEHIKINDTAASVQKISAEKTAGKNDKGSVDLIWINGENFSQMKSQGLLFGPFTQKLPDYKYVDTSNQSLIYDFNQAVDGMESPWGTARLAFIYDSARLKTPPADISALYEFTKKNPGKFAYPAPPNFHGTTFIKQLLIELTNYAPELNKPYTEAAFNKITPKLWAYLDKIHPHLWGKGDMFPRDTAHLYQMLDDRVLDIVFTFNPNEARSAFLNGKMPETVRTYVHKKGTIGNAHFLAIPFNSASKEAAMHRREKPIPKIWGDPTVLDLKKLSAEDRRHFESIDIGVQALPLSEQGNMLREPHSSWVEPLETAWKKRYYR
ncbi:hypothetical protein CHS0354_002018 [Potamilus streckersoni]|uniref:ABC transporter substrate-binding protein n=1 Tax=Potamilus streckersoni TaxID=2493646 RepID=A0AAE0T6K0_9BIVA|nr:hypothetical protein CHS0354_002018 [Potamilus streckersoni]